jgi:hypothetical protein
MTVVAGTTALVMLWQTVVVVVALPMQMTIFHRDKECIYEYLDQE